MKRLPVAAILALSTLLLWGVEAQAYCRRRTVLDASVSCGSTGAPLWWRPRCVGYHMSESASSQVALADAIRVMNTSFDAWSTASCGNGSPSVQVSHLGTTSSEVVGFSKGTGEFDADSGTVLPNKNENIVIFRDDVWPHAGGDDALALTTFTYEKNTGEVFDADIEINSAGARLVLSGKPPSGKYELQSILTHEAGHFLGMGHTSVTGATMFPRYNPGTDGLASLEDDDIEGICATYLLNFTRATGAESPAFTPASANCAPADYVAPTATTRTSGCSCDVAQSSTSGAVWLIAAIASLALVAKRPRKTKHFAPDA